MSSRALVLVFFLGFAGCGPSTERGPYMLDGSAVDPFDTSAKATVLVFTRSDCPIANRYAPELTRLHGEYSGKDVAFWLVYPDDREGAESVAAHVEAFDVPLTPLLDPAKRLVDRVGVSISPEAAVFDGERRLVYRGRIDDRFPKLGVTRPPVERDLHAAIAATLDGRAAELVTTKAVGCYLSDLD